MLDGLVFCYTNQLHEFLGRGGRQSAADGTDKHTFWSDFMHYRVNAGACIQKQSAKGKVAGFDRPNKYGGA